MNQTALIWTLAITLAALCMLLAIDYILIWKRVLRDEVPKQGGQGRLPLQSAANEGACTGASGMRPKGISSHFVLRAPRATGAAEAVTARRDPTERVDGIDLCGRERPVFEVKLPPDGKVLHLLTPTKAVADRFQVIGELLERMEHNRLSMEGTEQLYKFSAILLSNNKEGVVFTPADLAERLTSEDVGALLGAYLSWLTSVIHSLN